jgi:hypothetical protein
MAAFLTQAYIVLLISIPIVGTLAELFCMQKAYSTYRLIGSRFENATFYWFYTALQSPWYASQFWGQADIAESLPADFKERVAIARRQIGYGTATVFLWVIFVFSFGAIAAYLRRHF